jgi:hypothetical protein
MYKFIYTREDDSPDPINDICFKIDDACTHNELLDVFEKFVKACGYIIDDIHFEEVENININNYCPTGQNVDTIKNCDACFVANCDERKSGNLCTKINIADGKEFVDEIKAI